MADKAEHNRVHIVRKSSRSLLTDWLNLDSKEFTRRHREVLSELRKYRKEHERRDNAIAGVRAALQSAWEETEDIHARSSYLFEARRIYREAEAVAEIGTIVEGGGFILSPPDPEEPFHKAIFNLYATRALPRLSKCARGKDCPEPYFIRRRPKKQPYCTTECHEISLSESKNRYEQKRSRERRRN